ncbi:MAG: type II toxin-antitoxin system prevent-host-death family antitoxin [Actinomycetota bacterium]|nr:type II toxin-antitoxin system prevent-host-death family antitoxin [Actinomycetota bacterium]
METANVHEAKTNLSKLLDAAERGEQVFITRRGGTVTRFAIVPAPLVPRSQLFGALRGQIAYAPDDDSADAEIAAMFDQA